MDSILDPLLAILVVLLPIWLVYGYLELQAWMSGMGKAMCSHNPRREGDASSGKASR